MRSAKTCRLSGSTSTLPDETDPLPLGKPLHRPRRLLNSPFAASPTSSHRLQKRMSLLLCHPRYSPPWSESTPKSH